MIWLPNEIAHFGLGEISWPICLSASGIRVVLVFGSLAHRSTNTQRIVGNARPPEAKSSAPNKPSKIVRKTAASLVQFGLARILVGAPKIDGSNIWFGRKRHDDSPLCVWPPNISKATFFSRLPIWFDCHSQRFCSLLHSSIELLTFTSKRRTIITIPACLYPSFVFSSSCCCYYIVLCP